jgi:hypothetical protein
MANGRFCCRFVQTLDVMNVTYIGFDVLTSGSDVVGSKLLLFDHLSEMPLKAVPNFIGQKLGKGPV